MKSFGFSFLISVLIPASGFAQELNLKQNDFFMGEAIGTDSAQLKMEARKELILSIQNILSVESSSTTAETERGISSSIKQKINSWSWVRLSGISFSSFDLPDGKVKVIAWISKSDYRKSMDDLAGELITAWELASEREKTAGLSSVIPDYYLIYLKSWYSPEPVRTAGIQDLKSWTAGKIKGFLKDVLISQGDLKADDGDETSFEIPLQFSYEKKPVSGLTFREETESLTPRPVTDGRGLLVSHSFPSSGEKIFRLRLTPAFDPKSSGGELDEILTLFPLEESRTVTADFTALIEVDFTVTRLENDVLLFKPVIKNLSVSSLEWDFGDGSRSYEQAPRQIYLDQTQHYTVGLLVNKNKRFSVTKTLSGTGTLVSVEKAQVPAGSGAKSEKTGPGDPKKLLLSEKQAESLLSLLEGYREAGKLVFGSKKDFLFPEKCWVVVYHPETKEIKGWLEPADGGYRDVTTGRKTSGLKDYKGLSAIYIDFK
ncbi:MAG: hypothetical protein L6Q77_13940 [Bacteroidetes bacterium]|nr:hypothetical protein [Bacteroidota bacterium]